jgi:DNA polymerase
VTTTHRRLSIDFETRSLVDLRRAGVYAYSEDASTSVICMSYAFDDEPVRTWYRGQEFPDSVRAHVAAAGEVRAWNANFELTIWNNTLTRQVPGLPVLSPAQTNDTMARAAYWGLPLSLDDAGPAAGVHVQKDKEGHALMMRMCRPRSFDPLTGAVEWWDEADPERLLRLGAYCDRDVEVERALANAIPELPPEEQQTWWMDARINARGVPVDYRFVERLRVMALEAAKQVNRDLEILSRGRVKSVQNSIALLAWLKELGYPYNDLKKDTVAARMDEPDVSDLELAALELRANGAKTSAAKLKAMLDASITRQGIGLVRGMLQYYGASRTGRWAGRLIQLQNLPRGSIKELDAAVAMIDAGATDDQIAAVFGGLLDVVTSALRSCIVAPPGMELVVADFSQIEARVVAWLSGQQDALDVFTSGEDIYVHTAAKIGSKDRQLGKVLVLACGFGMSGDKFHGTAEKAKVKLSLEDARSAVRAWRNANANIVSFWWDCDRAAKQVISHPGQVVRVGQVLFGMYGRHMLVRLPSGRNLVYRDAELRPHPERPGEVEITYMGVNQYTRKWTRLRTYGGKLVENITQATARDVMRDAMLRAEDLGHDVRLTVHDELLSLSPTVFADARLAELLDIMRTPPKWATGLPVNGAGWVGPRYKK